MRKDSYKVGITVVLETGHSVFSNGIRQNGMMLAKLLKLAGHEVTLINFISSDKAETNYPWSQEEYKTKYLESIPHRFSLSFNFRNTFLLTLTE